MTRKRRLSVARRILGMRVSELEKKLKTLEVTGLWSSSGENVSGEQITDLIRN